MAAAAACFASYNPTKRGLRELEQFRHNFSEAVFACRHMAMKSEYIIYLRYDAQRSRFVISDNHNETFIPFGTSGVTNCKFLGEVSAQGVVKFYSKFHQPFRLQFSFYGQPKTFVVNEYSVVKKL
jgi:hypothetical protein